METLINVHGGGWPSDWPHQVRLDFQYHEGPRGQIITQPPFHYYRLGSVKGDKPLEGQPSFLWSHGEVMQGEVLQLTAEVHESIGSSDYLLGWCTRTHKVVVGIMDPGRAILFKLTWGGR